MKAISKFWSEILDECGTDVNKISPPALLQLQEYFVGNYLGNTDRDTKIFKELEHTIKIIASSVCSPKEMVRLTQTLYYVSFVDNNSEENPMKSDVHQCSKKKAEVDEFRKTAVSLLSSMLQIACSGPEREKRCPWEKKAYEEFFKVLLPAPAKDLGSILLQITSEGIWNAKELLDSMPWVLENNEEDSVEMARILDKILASRLEGFTLPNAPHCIDTCPEEKKASEVLTEIKKAIKAEPNERSVQNLCKELRNKECLDQETIDRSESIVHKIKAGLDDCIFETETDLVNMKSKLEILKTKNVSQLTEDEIVSILSSLSIIVKQVFGYMPRATQLLSCVLLILTKESGGRMVEIATGEGKSCIIAMLSAFLASSGKYVDIVTSSPVLAKRDQEKWAEFYSQVGITVSNNVDDDDKKISYQSNIVYGTVSTFASDILTQEFMKKDVRGDRKTDAVIVDEIDFMLLDQGVQFTYLSSPSPGLHHLEVLFATVWNITSKYIPITLNGHISYLEERRAFHSTIAKELGMEDPLQILELGVAENILDESVVQTMRDWSGTKIQAEHIMKISPSKLVEIVKVLEKTVKNISFQVYELRDSVPTLFYKGPCTKDQSCLDLLLFENGLCSVIHNDESYLKGEIIKKIKELINNKEVSTPSFLQDFALNRLEIWIENAFSALEMCEGREYLIEDNRVIPVDYKSTGMIEKNKKWGDGLQQFVEMKHRVPLSSSSLVTNFMSNLAFFHRYGGKVFGVTGTLGSETDKEFLKYEYSVDFCSIPTHRIRKLYEKFGIIKQNKTEWLEGIKEAICCEVGRKAWNSDGRAALVICQDINTAEEVRDVILVHQKNHKEIKDVKIYTHSGSNSVLDTELSPGEVVVATNLAGRGTDVKINDMVKEAGGLFVLLTFFPSNTRVEQQAFGRSGRKGLPGSSQMVLNGAHMEEIYQPHRDSMDKLKYVRDKVEKARVNAMIESEVAEIKLKENLFEIYNRETKDIATEIDEFPDQDEKEITIAALHEKWGMWLQMKSEAIEVAKPDWKSLEEDLVELVKNFKDKISGKTTPSSNFYSVTRLGNEALLRCHYSKAIKLYEEAIHMDGEWTCIAQYNKAYCIIEEPNEKYSLDVALGLLQSAQNAIGKNIEETSMIGSLTKNCFSLEKQDRGFDEKFAARGEVLNHFYRNIEEAAAKLEQIINDDKEADAEACTIFTLVPNKEEHLHDELTELWRQGLVNVFSVKEKPSFCWEGLLVCIIGALQVAAGALIAAVSGGLLSNIGISMMQEGVSDMKEGIKGMIQGTFSWIEWGISKAISLVTSIIAFGISSLAKDGIKGTTDAIKEAWKGAKEVTKGVARMGKGLFKTTMKGAFKVATKELMKEGIMKVGDKIGGLLIDAVFDEIKKKWKENYQKEMKEIVDKKDFAIWVEGISLHLIHGNDKENDGDPKNTFTSVSDVAPEVRRTFRRIANHCIDEYTKVPEWQDYCSDISSGIEGKLGPSALARAITAVSVVESLSKGIIKIVSLAKGFGDSYRDAVSTFSEQEQIQKPECLDASEELKELRAGIVEDVSERFCATCIDIVKQNLGKPFVDLARSKINEEMDDMVNIKGGYADLQGLILHRRNAAIRDTPQFPGEELALWRKNADIGKLGENMQDDPKYDYERQHADIGVIA